MPIMEESWQLAAVERQNEINSCIPSAYLVNDELLENHNALAVPRMSGIMSERELKVTECRAVDLLHAIRQRTYTSVEVVTAFCKRAAIAHQATNCLAAVLFEDAIETARELDRYMEKHGRPKGPLHGLPISVKEHVYLQGTVATSGLMEWKDAISPEDALIVRIFREAGAVFHVKTTNPQTLMALETHSNLFGRTLNPFNKNLTSGGSSGGEAALIAMRGSVLGIGTDIGGSIRLPSAFCGGYGLKPSIARLPHSGLSGLHAGMENIVGCVGPMANCIEDLRLFADVALAYQPWDYEPSLIEMPWRQYQIHNLSPRLKFGVMWDDGVVKPHPPITRALKQTVDALRRAGHSVVEWDPQYHASLVEWANRAYFLDGAQEYHDMLNPEKDPAVPIVEWLLDSHAGERCTLEDSWKINSERDYLRASYMAQWRLAGIDAVLCPANPSVASAHGESKYWGYTSAFNALDLPGTVFPVGTVQATDVLKSTPYQPLSEKDREYRRFYEDRGPAKYKDAPISLQLIGRRLQEEKLLAMTEVVEQALRADRRAVVDTSQTIPMHAAGRRSVDPQKVQPGKHEMHASRM